MGSKSKALILFLILSIATSIGVMPVYAKNNVSKDFGQSTYNATLPAYNATGQELFAYNVTMTIETELNGHWIANKAYEISWNITLTYLNESVFNSSTFYVYFYGANPFGIPNFEGTLNAISSKGNISQQEPSIRLSDNYTTPNTPMTVDVDSRIPFLFCNNGQVVVTPSFDYWIQPSPIDITAATTSMTLFTPLTIITITIIVIIASVVVSLLLYRRRHRTIR